MIVADCDGCAAPCCRVIVLRDGRGAGLRAAEARSVHDRAGARLRLIAWEPRGRRGRAPVFSCGGLVDGRCAIYARRPDHCREYDCTEDADRMRGDAADRPRCAWPRRGRPRRTPPGTTTIGVASDEG